MNVFSKGHQSIRGCRKGCSCRIMYLDAGRRVFCRMDGLVGEQRSERSNGEVMGIDEVDKIGVGQEDSR